MEIIPKLKPQILELVFQHNSHSQAAPIYVIDIGISNGHKPILVLPGMGEDLLVSMKLARYLRSIQQPAVVGILTFPTKESISPMSSKGPGIIAAYINKQYGYKTSSTVNTISHSQSGTSHLVASNNSSQLLGGRHVSITPASLNSHFLGNGLEKRSKEFWRRYRKLVMDKRHLHFDSWRIGFDLTKRFTQDIIGSKLTKKYNVLNYKINYALCDDTHNKVISGLSAASKKGKIMIISGNSDPLFRGDEYDFVLRKYNLKNQVVHMRISGSHETLVSRPGKKQLLTALEFINSA